MNFVQEFTSMPNLVDILIQQVHLLRGQSPAWIFTGDKPILPITAGGYTLRGLEKIEQEHYREAIADFNRAIGLDAYHVLAYFYRGLAHSKLLDRPRAIADYSQVIELKPKLAFAYAFRGDLHLALGASSTALDDYLRAAILLKQMHECNLTKLVTNKIHWLQHKQALAVMNQTWPDQNNLYNFKASQVPNQNTNLIAPKRSGFNPLLQQASLGKAITSNAK